MVNIAQHPCHDC